MPLNRAMAENRPPVRILHLEDSARDADLIRILLNAAGSRCEMIRAAHRAQFEEALERGGFDLILCDFNLAGFDGLSALKLAKAKHPAVPVIIVSGALDAEEAVECLRAGATDYLFKQRLERLPSAVQRALDEAHAQAQRQESEARLRESETRFRAVAENLGDGLVLTALDDTILDVNPRLTEMTGYAREELIGHHSSEHLNDASDAEEMKRHNAKRAEGRSSIYEMKLRRKDGTRFETEITGAPLRDQHGGIFGTVGVIRDISGRKQVEEALKESERRHRTLLGNLQGMAYRCRNDRDWTMEFVSEGVRALLGLAPEDLTSGRITYHSLIHPDDRDLLWQKSQESFAARRPCHTEYRVRHADGTWRWVWDQSHGIGGARGEVPAVEGYITDVTERRLTEDTLRLLSTGVANLHGDAFFEAMAREAARLLGVDVGFVCQLTSAGAPPPRVRTLGWCVDGRVQDVIEYEVAGTPCQSALDHGAAFFDRDLQALFPLDTMLQDFGLHAFAAVAMLDGGGRVVGHVGAMSRRPLPEIHRMESTLRLFAVRAAAELERQKLDARFHDLFEFAPDAIMMANAAGSIQLVNRQAEQLFGYERGELVGQPVEILIPASRGQGDGPRTMGTGRSDLHGRKKDGTVFPADISLSPLESEEGRLVVAAVRDVTERQRATEVLERTARELTAAKTALEAERAQLADRVAARTAELTVANAELEHANRLKSEFLANMSHELRTPLNAILGLSEALLEQIGGPLTPRQVRSTTTIHTSGQHLLALINDILDLSKIEAGKLELRSEKMSVDELCQSCLGFVKTQAMKKRIQVASENDGRAAHLRADPKRLKQILVNLLTNAVKFTPEGGRIGLTVTAPPGEDMVRFTVWDTGIGLAPDDAARLFRPFTQIDSGLNRAQEGTGLGLALVAKLTDLHGGSVAVESAPGQGSRFTVTLPLTPEPEAGSDRGGSAAPARKSPHVVIVEDEPAMAYLLGRYLTGLGFRSVVCARGDEAVEAIAREQPKVVLLDIELPGISGWEVLKRLKADSQTHDIPVLVVSGANDPEQSRAHGAAGHLTKPFTCEQFLELLEHSVGRKAAPSASAAPRPASRSGPRILLAEDNEANIETLGGYLEETGYEMHYAPNGLVAVNLARELRPALILMDVQMPVMDGLTAIREIRADPALRDIPIITLTGLAMPGDRERCLEAGAVDYLTKPVSLRELVQRMQLALDGARSAGERAGGSS